MNRETLGPAERIIQSALTYTDHAVHNRPGAIVPDPTNATQVRWAPVVTKKEGDDNVVLRLDKVGKKTTPVRIGLLEPGTDRIVEGGRLVAQYRPAGLFPEVVAWLYRQVAEVWQLDNEFAAKWASHAFTQEHRDLKVVLAAFMLVQSRRGDPVVDQGKIAFFDQDYRDIGEAMALLQQKDMTPKIIVRIHSVLSLPQVAELNRQLGFTQSARRPFYGRWPRAVEKWLQFRERNPKLLDSLVKEGWGSTVRLLARQVGYVPETTDFFAKLRWRQKQAKDGRRKLALGQAVKAAETESWAALSEAEICQRVMKEKPSWKRLSSLVPESVGLTRAITAAAIEAGVLSDKDLIILTPTLEELGLLQVEGIKFRWQRAIQHAEDMRAANIARNVKSQEVKEKLEDAADNALKNAVAEVVKDMRIYVFVDTSGSMNIHIAAAKQYIARFLQGFPLDRMHVARFTTTGHEVQIPAASAVGVEQAFRGVTANGGTDYGSGVTTLSGRRPKENEDVLFIFIGDEEANNFEDKVRRSGLNPMAFGLVKVVQNNWKCVQNTAANLGIPCFVVDEKIFADPYAIPRTIQALISATPVGQTAAAVPKRETLVDIILKTKLLAKPAWAA